MSASESRFTKATDLCPHPEWWTADDNPDATEHEVSEMVYGLVRGLQPRYCLETGTAFGHTASRIAQALLENNHGELVTIEKDADRLAEFKKKLVFAEASRLLISAKPLPILSYGGDSLSWQNIIDDELVFDFCWFDSHYSLRVPEFLHFRQWMRAGTIVCFHDTAPGHGGAWASGSDIRSVIASNLRSKMRMIHLPTPRGLTIGEVLP